ncbi:MAG: methylenetetrahydrofolate reductase [NAD(P)H] [Pseudomonadota bacterium]
MKKVDLSFEFFPPKTDAGVAKLAVERKKLLAAKPEFFSVTYGAGGSTRDRTFDVVMQSIQDSGVDTAPHLSCVGENKARIGELLKQYRKAGIKRLVALRGDLPSGSGLSSGELNHAIDLVRFIRESEQDYFWIEVAAYPEMHPQAKHFDQDFDYFKAKVAAGANSAITQYFYNADAYRFFMDRCQSAGITIPVIPGIMPITNYEKLARFSDMCGAEIPRWIVKRLEAYRNDEASIISFGADVVAHLVEAVIKDGAPGIHFYTLNDAEPSLKICQRLNLI